MVPISSSTDIVCTVLLQRCTDSAEVGYIILLVTATGVVLVMSRSACEDVGIRRMRMWEHVRISQRSHSL